MTKRDKEIMRVMDEMITEYYRLVKSCRYLAMRHLYKCLGACLLSFRISKSNIFNETWKALIPYIAGVNYRE